MLGLLTMAAAQSPLDAARDRGASRDEENLLSRLEAGDDEGVLAEIVRRYQDRVFRLAVSILGPGAELEAEDVAQEVFLQVHRKLSTFRSESRLSTWLYRIAYRKAIDFRRRARHRLPHVGEDTLQEIAGAGADEVLSGAIAEQRRGELLRALDTLPAAQRSALYLHYWLGHSVDETAELLRMSPGTVKSHLHRARRRLARRLEESS